jgi:hypothetical protein
VGARALALYRSLGLKVVAAISEGLRHLTHGYVGLCVLDRGLIPGPHNSRS